jgi:hypothetical protein
MFTYGFATALTLCSIAISVIAGVCARNAVGYGDAGGACIAGRFSDIAAGMVLAAGVLAWSVHWMVVVFAAVAAAFMIYDARRSIRDAQDTAYYQRANGWHRQ